MTRDGRDLSAADVTTSRHRKLRAPREDRGVLIDPTWGAFRKSSLAMFLSGDWSFEAAGESIANVGCVAACRVCRRSSRVYSDLSQCESREAPLPADFRLPLLLAGHQPELFHPGVWAKNFALSGLASATARQAVNLVIDGDTLKAASLRAGSAEMPSVESVPSTRRATKSPTKNAGLPMPDCSRPSGQRHRRYAAALDDGIAAGIVLARGGAAVARSRHDRVRRGSCPAHTRRGLGAPNARAHRSRLCDSHAFPRVRRALAPRFAPVSRRPITAS